VATLRKFVEKGTRKLILPAVSQVDFMATGSVSLARTEGGCKGSTLAPTEDVANGGETSPGTDGTCGRDD
jgi:hypothetical protein